MCMKQWLFEETEEKLKDEQTNKARGGERGAEMKSERLHRDKQSSGLTGR